MKCTNLINEGAYILNQPQRCKLDCWFKKVGVSKIIDGLESAVLNMPPEAVALNQGSEIKIIR